MMTIHRHLNIGQQVIHLIAALLFATLNFKSIVIASSFNNDDYTNDDLGIFEASRKSTWLYSSKAMAIEYHGCTWSYADNTDDAGCLEASSEDGLTSWYLMSNCRRTQAVYSVYSVDDSTSISCSKNTYKGTFISKTGMYDFASYLSGYDEYSLISGDDDHLAQENYPMCEYDDSGYYRSVGCANNGDLTIDLFNDAYCLSKVDTYKTLQTLTNKLNYYKSCHQVYSSSNGNSPEYSLVGYTLQYSESCNQIDTPYCFDIDGSKTKSLKQTSNGSFHNIKHYNGQTFASKMKYALGSFFVVSSFIMFVGILFANRRKRRAMLRRHFRRKGYRRRRSKSGDKRWRSRKRQSKSDGDLTNEDDEDEDEDENDTDEKQTGTGGTFV